ncbi:MAG: nucleotidyltransferase [Bryobacteraceae bacterium]
MPLSKHLREFAELLNSNGVEFVIVGAYAVVWHGFPRYTADLDLLVRPTAANAAIIVEAIRQFGFGSLGISQDDLAHPNKVVQLGVEPYRIDLITSISGVSFDEAWAGKLAGDLDGVPVYFIGLDDLIRNKESAGRPKDLGDAGELRRRKPKR